MILGFEGGNELGVGLELDQVIKTCGLVLDGISELTQAPILFVHNLTAIVADELGVLGNRFLHLGLRQNGSCNENGFVLVNHCLLINCLLNT